MEGEYKWWHENGNLWVHACKIDGKLEGECKEWHDNGQLMTCSFYRDGKIEGKYETYYENGSPQLREFYKQGIREGKVINWNNDGYPRSQKFYQAGKLEGEMKLNNLLYHYYCHAGYILSQNFDKKKMTFLKVKKFLFRAAKITLSDYIIKDLRSISY